MEIDTQNNFYGDKMYELAKKLFPLCRSITGKGLRDSLYILNEVLGERERERERERGFLYIPFQVEQVCMIG